jgi:hypothetical protein
MKTFREYINLIESAQHGEPLAEGVMDRLRRIYMGLVYDRPMGTPDSEFLAQWQREIKDQLGQDIDLDTLSRLQQNFRERGQTMMARGDAADYHREMGITEQGVSEDRRYQSKSQWMEAIRRLNPKVQFVDDDRGITAVQGAGKKIAGEWNDDFGSGVVYTANIRPKLRLVKGVSEGQTRNKTQKELAYHQGIDDYENPEVTASNHKSWGEYARYYIEGWKSAQELEAGSNRDWLERQPERFDDEYDDEQDVSEGSKLDRFMRRYVPGSARRQIDDKIKDQQFTQLIARDGDPADPQNQKEIDQTQRNIRRLNSVGKKDVQEGSAEKYSYRVTFDDGTHNTVAIPVSKIFQGDNSAKDLITRHFARKGRTVKDIEMMFRPDSVQEGDQELEETQQAPADPVAEITRLSRDINR